MTLGEAAERLGVSARRARQLVERGQLPAVRRGPIWLTTAEAVDHYRRNTTGGGRPLAERTAARRHASVTDSDGFSHRLLTPRVTCSDTSWHWGVSQLDL